LNLVRYNSLKRFYILKFSFYKMPKITKEKLVHCFKHYFLNLVLIWAAILLYRLSDYYISFLRPESQATLIYLALAYTFFGFFYYILFPIERLPKSKGGIIFSAIKRGFRDLARYFRSFSHEIRHPLPRFEKHEKTALLFVIVKLFFLPIMLNFFFSNYFAIKSQLARVVDFGISSLFSIQGFNGILFPFLLTAIFLFDTLWFAFGYSFEAGFLKNKIRSVEPTILGWGVALICYPPFNGLFSKYLKLSWYANDYALFPTEIITFCARMLVLIFLGIYLFATFALGTKCSNLTNRGIVSRGVYKYVRHPAYISKNLAWWITIIPVFGPMAFLSMFLWSGIYFMRAITEERHLIKDPDYQKYVKKVKYRFIPGVY